MNIGIAALWSLTHTITSVIALFVVFRLGFRDAGADFVGLWALLSGILVFARLADNGASIAISRTIILSEIGGRYRIGPVLWAGLSIATGSTFILSAVLMAVAGIVLYQIDLRDISGVSFKILIVVAFIYAVGNSTSGVLGGCLDGSGRMTARYVGSIIANVALIFLSIWLLPALGAIGFLLSHAVYVVLQILIFVGLIISSRSILLTDVASYINAVHDVAGYLSKTIFIGAARAGFEPVSKLLIGIFGGLSAVAMFDLAARVSTQLRQLANAPLQPIAVITARQTSKLDVNHKTIIERWIFLSSLAAIGVSSAQILLSPIVSLLIFDSFESTFYLFSAILAVASFVNFIGTVAFYVIMAGGKLKYLVILHLLMTILNLILGVLFGYVWGVNGIAVAWGLVFAFGGPFVFLLYNQDNPMSSAKLFSLSLIVALGSAALAFIALIVWEKQLFIMHVMMKAMSLLGIEPL